jgi:hypothetical protein
MIVVNAIGVQAKKADYAFGFDPLYELSVPRR